MLHRSHSLSYVLTSLDSFIHMMNKKNMAFVINMSKRKNTRRNEVQIRTLMLNHIRIMIAQMAATVIALAPNLPANCQNQPLPPKPAQLNAETYKSVLEHGLNHQFEFAFFPVGKLRIMGPQESEITERMGQSGDWQRLEFPGRMLAFLEQAERDGFLKIEEQKVEGLGALLMQGARFFVALPTEKLIKLQDLKSSTSTYIKVQLGKFDVTEIISDEAFTPPKGLGGPCDQFRLILGKVRDIPTSQSMELGPNYIMGSGEEFKFRAVMQVNPFTKSREFVMADIGKVDRNDWLSGFVEMGQIPSHLRAPQIEDSKIAEKQVKVGEIMNDGDLRDVAKQAKEFLDAMMTGQFGRVVDATPPELITRWGGREKSIQQSASFMNELRLNGMTMKGFTVGALHSQFSDNMRRWLVFPVTLEAEHPKAFLKSLSYLLAVSEDGDKTWRFASVTDDIRQMLPSLPASLILPQSPPPQIIAR